jgi:hypothetical protein
MSAGLGATAWGVVWRGVVGRYALGVFGFIAPALIAQMAGLTADASAPVDIATLWTMLVVVVSIPLFINDMSKARRVWRAERRRVFDEAVTRLGASQYDVELSLNDKIRRVVWDSKGMLASAAALEFFFAMPLLMGILRGFRFEHPFNVVVYLAMALPVPLYVLWKLRMNLHFDADALDTVRAERAYREAIKDREELAGGLALDEHARREGGELTVQAEAGGLEVREEVTLGLDAVGEETSREVSAARRAADA